MDLFIREAQAEDAADILLLINELATISGEKSPLNEEYITQYLQSPASTVLLAETDGQTVGLLSYSVRPDLYHAQNSCLIEEMVVRESMRDRGVGSALIAELFSQLSDRNCAEVCVAVMPDNIRAIQFYHAHGMTDEAVFLERHFSG